VTVYQIATIQRWIGLDADIRPTGLIPYGSRFLVADTAAEEIYYGGDPATGVLDVADVPDVGDTLLVGAVTYTFVAGVDFNAAGEIAQGATVAAAVANIVAAINGTDGVNTANADASAVAGTGEVSVTARAVGTAGNSLDTVYTPDDDSANAFAAATLLGAVDAWIELP
jgi:hypothetical protein